MRRDKQSSVRPDFLSVQAPKRTLPTPVAVRQSYVFRSSQWVVGKSSVIPEQKHLLVYSVSCEGACCASVVLLRDSGASPGRTLI